ncbi:complex I NDUFA9 subunit family protein [Haloarcula pellucida]|uniref:NADH dehydrogenase n=1 Tax=Haloarcula pellucida TaxID=1427151 RepID=A0A830GL34_9EURY|nr:complex I NDUFA9 subunit family protein [Halomicroarcula pellucida]MBX0348600.1 complex I NDUFA9 subunit family protein [Halomicroarcula pellucida]GGN92659.1 NADH dehydrogenase [Halomicroarcula pellucida]
MDVLVVGGTGFIGQYLCRELDDRGHEVTALARNPHDADLPTGVTRKEGDVTDYDSIEGAFEGQDAVVFLPALSPLFKPDSGNEMHEVVHLGGTENSVRAAEEHGVDRFLQMSALGADRNAATHYLRAKGKAEEVVEDSDLDWVIFRPSIVFGDGDEFAYFTKRLKQIFAPGVPLYPLPGGGGKAHFQLIWVEDFVPMLADALEGDEHVGQIYEVGGPETLSLKEATELVFEAEGKSITIVPLPMPLAKIGLPVLGALGFPMGSDQYEGLDFDNTPRENDVGAFGVDPNAMRTYGDYLGVE